VLLVDNLASLSCNGSHPASASGVAVTATSAAKVLQRSDLCQQRGRFGELVAEAADAGVHGGDGEARVLALATHDWSERGVPGRVAPATATARRSGGKALRNAGYAGRGTLDTPVTADTHRSSRSCLPGSWHVLLFRSSLAIGMRSTRRRLAILCREPPSAASGQRGGMAVLSLDKRSSAKPPARSNREANVRRTTAQRTAQSNRASAAR
jgi:hypothetical protein